MHGMTSHNYDESLNRKWLVTIRIKSRDEFYYRGIASFSTKREAKRFVKNQLFGREMRIIEQ